MKNNEIKVPASALLKIIKSLLERKSPQVCRHYVAASLVSTLEEFGYKVSSELAKAIIGADDEFALEIIRMLEKQDEKISVDKNN